VDLNFEIVFDKEKESGIQQIKRWIKKQRPPLNIILEYLFSYIEKWYFESKVKSTMREIDQQVKYIGDIWDKEDELNKPKAEIMEEGLFGEEGWSISISNPVVERGSKEPGTNKGTGENEKGLGDKFPDPWN